MAFPLFYSPQSLTLTHFLKTRFSKLSSKALLLGKFRIRELLSEVVQESPIPDDQGFGTESASCRTAIITPLAVLSGLVIILWYGVPSDAVRLMSVPAMKVPSFSYFTHSDCILLLSSWVNFLYTKLDLKPRLKQYANHTMTPLCKRPGSSCHSIKPKDLDLIRKLLNYPAPTHF